jgi:hypothetical protein
MCACLNARPHARRYIYPSMCLLVCLFIRLYRGVISVPMLSFGTNSMHSHAPPGVSICLSTYLSTCLLVCLFIRLYRGVISVPMLSFSTNSRHSHDHAVSSRWGCVGSRMRRGCRFRKPYRLCILMSDVT